MNASFDPYLKWLGIRHPERPPNHYRLLGIDVFESDPDVIATAADRQMAHVRRYQSGSHAQASQDLLNELAAAKLLLLSPERRADYSERLRQGTSSERSAVVPLFRLSVAIAVVIGAILLGIGLYATSDRGNTEPTSEMVATSDDTVRPEPAVAKNPPEVDDKSRNSADGQTSDTHGSSVELPNGSAGEDHTDEGLTGEDVTEKDTAETNTIAPESETEEANETEPTNVTSPPPPATQPPWDIKFGKGPYPYPKTGTIWDDTKLAISTGDLEAAEDELASIRRQTDQLDDDSMLRGLTQIVHVLRKFDLAVQHALNRGVTPGTLLAYGNFTVEFQGVDAEQIHLAAANGEEKSFPTNAWEMPAPLASTLADVGLPKSESVRLVLGTFWAFNQRGDITTADVHWQHARRLNDDVDLMLSSWTTASSPIRKLDGQAPAQLASVPPKAKFRSTWTQIQFELELAQRATTEQDLRDIANELLRRAETENDSTIKYVCLKQAMDYATRSRDVTIALNAINETRTTYDVPAAELKSWLNDLRRETTDVGQLVLIAEVAVNAAKAKIDEDQYDGVKELLAIAIISARAENASLAENAKQLQKDAKMFKRFYREVLPAREILAKSPDDAEANTKIGQFLCYTKGDFARGLPYLAKSHEESLRDLARRSLGRAQPTLMDEIEIADHWWDVAQGKQINDFQRANIRTYARDIWYRPATARSSLTVAQRKHVQSRLRSQ